MATEEITIAEILREHAYQTGIFGKWHLGDNYPYRPIYQCFSDSFVFRGGGHGQPGDYDNYFAGDSADFNPVMNNRNLENTKKVYGMMSNIDENIGRLIKELENLDVMKNTAIIFLSDNGPQQNRYMMGIRGRKGMGLSCSI